MRQEINTSEKIIMKVFGIFCSLFFILNNVPISGKNCDQHRAHTNNYSESYARPVLYMPAREARDKELLSQKTQKDPIQPKKCPFCRMNDEHEDKKNLVLARFTHFMVALNLYPYSRGHLLILPYQHVKNVTDLSPASFQELMTLICTCVKVVQTVGKADGINVGMNIGDSAGASITDHLHAHIVPRFAFEGKSFLNCIAEARVVSWNLNTLYDEFYAAFKPVH